MSDEWVMVPREPTEAMIRAGYSAPTVFGVRDMANTYRAMLAAAPDAPQRNREADRARYIDRAFNEWLDDSVADGGATVWDLVSDVHSAWAAWTAHPNYAAPAAPQQAEPAAQIGWADEFGNIFPMAAWKPAQRTHHDAHKTAWRPVFLHPPAAEVQAGACPHCGSDCNERDELEKAEREINRLRAAPQQADPVGYFVNDESDDQWHQVDYEQRNGADTYPLYLHPPAAEVQQAEPRDVCDVCNALTVPRNATRYDADDLKAAQVRGKIIAARLQQQAEPVAQIGWSDEFGNLFPMAAWKPAQRTHHDSHKTAWRPVFLHQPAAEVQLLRDAVAKLSTIVRVPNAEHIADEHNAAVAFLRRALEGGE